MIKTSEKKKKKDWEESNTAKYTGALLQNQVIIDYSMTVLTPTGQE